MAIVQHLLEEQVSHLLQNRDGVRDAARLERVPDGVYAAPDIGNEHLRKRRSRSSIRQKPDVLCWLALLASEFTCMRIARANEQKNPARHYHSEIDRVD